MTTQEQVEWFNVTYDIGYSKSEIAKLEQKLKELPT